MEELVDIDYSKELDSNMQLREATEQRKNEYLESLRNGTLERRRLLCKKLRISFFWILAAVLLGIIILFFRQGINIEFNKGVGILSLFCFSWATLGRLGWEGQTFGGNTVFEKLDSGLFWALYFFGTLFGTISIAVS